jgi:DNA-binding response OmpR family regulator
MDPQLRLLCVEDDSGHARLIRKTLEAAGYAVDQAADGEAGLAKLQAGLYDVVLLDYQMPMLTGLQVLGRMATHGPFPPTIMLTASGDERTAVEAMKLGARDYVVKDPDGGFLTVLPAVIEQVLAVHRLAEDKRRLEAERERLVQDLQEALANIKTLRGLVPICAWCKKIRDDQGYWTQLETYLKAHTEADFTHAMCAECAQKLMPP